MFAVFLVSTVLTVIGVQAGPICPAKDGPDSVYFPDEDCSKFWQCSNGTPYLFDCPSGLHFNPKLNVCDWPNQAGCEGDPVITNNDSNEDSSSSESIEDDNSGEESSEEVDNNDSVSDEENSSSVDSSSSESEENTVDGSQCPVKDGEFPVYIPDKNCTKFWECSNGTPYLFDCPDILHFNPKLNACDWPEQAGCQSG